MAFKLNEGEFEKLADDKPASKEEVLIQELRESLAEEIYARNEERLVFICNSFDVT